MIEKNICFTTRIDTKDAPSDDVYLAPTELLTLDEAIEMVSSHVFSSDGGVDRQKEAMKVARTKGDDNGLLPRSSTIRCEDFDELVLWCLCIFFLSIYTSRYYINYLGSF